MLNLGDNVSIYVHTRATDMRKGFAGLSSIVRSEFESDPTDGSLFVFINQRRDRMKLLQFSRGGFWLYYRLLEAGTFEALTAASESSRIQIDATELSMLLAGVKLSSARQRRQRYSG